MSSDTEQGDAEPGDAEPGDGGQSDAEPADPGLDVLLRERGQLTGLAYRMLGSVTEAEDVVQETHARWCALPRAQRDAIESPGAWATTVASRICLDVLGSARVRRESYVGEWIPEPVPGGLPWTGAGGAAGSEPQDPAERVALDESITMAFLVVLESMTPAERVSFVLHDVFGYPFAEVAGIVGRSAAACRQLAVSARRRVHASKPQPRAAVRPSDARRSELVRAFRDAWQAKDLPALVALLDADATSVADSGGRADLAFVSIAGAESIARAFVELTGRVPDLTVREGEVNGRPGLLVEQDGVTVSVLALDVADGRITRIWTVRNPDKLRLW